MKGLIIEFVAVFAIVLATAAGVTYLWNVVAHGAGGVDWENSFRFAILFGIILRLLKLREVKTGKESN